MCHKDITTKESVLQEMYNRRNNKKNRKAQVLEIEVMVTDKCSAILIKVTSYQNSRIFHLLDEKTFHCALNRADFKQVMNLRNIIIGNLNIFNSQIKRKASCSKRLN